MQYSALSLPTFVTVTIHDYYKHRSYDMPIKNETSPLTLETLRKVFYGAIGLTTEEGRDLIADSRGNILPPAGGWDEDVRYKVLEQYPISLAEIQSRSEQERYPVATPWTDLWKQITESMPEPDSV